MSRNAHIYATDPQRVYLRRLLREAFANGWAIGFDTAHTAENPRLLRSEASSYIERLAAAKAAGWERQS